MYNTPMMHIAGMEDDTAMVAPSPTYFLRYILFVLYNQKGCAHVTSLLENGR